MLLFSAAANVNDFLVSGVYSALSLVQNLLSVEVKSSVSIEELAIQLEEPFSILPMVGYSTTIGQNAEEIVTWSNIYDNDPVKAANDRVASVRTLE